MPSRRRQWSTSPGSGPASTTTPAPPPAASTVASPWPTSHIANRQPGGGQPVTTRVSGAGRVTSTTTSTPRQPAPHRVPQQLSGRPGRRPTVTAARASAPGQLPGQSTPAPGSAAPGRATPAIHPAGQLAHHASAFAAGIATGAVASAANPARRRCHRHLGQQVAGAPPPDSPGPTAPPRPARTACAAAAPPEPRRVGAAPGAPQRLAPARRQHQQRAGGQHGQQEAVSGPATGRTAPAAGRPWPAPGSGICAARWPGASSATAPQAVARRTLGSGRQTTTKPSVSAPASRAVARRESPRQGAGPRRSVRCAPGRAAPMSSASRTVRLLPETASVCARSVSLKAWSSSGCDPRGVPDDQPGQQGPRVCRQVLGRVPQARSEPPPPAVADRSAPPRPSAPAGPAPAARPRSGRRRSGRAPVARSPAAVWRAAARARRLGPPGRPVGFGRTAARNSGFRRVAARCRDAPVDDQQHGCPSPHPPSVGLLDAP